MKDKIGLIVLGGIVLVILGVVIFAPETDSYTNESNSVEESYEIVMGELSVDKFVSNLNSDELNVIYIMNEGCGYCAMFSPIIDSVVSKYDINAGYFNMAHIASEEEYNKFIDSNEYFSTSFGGTPTTLVVQNGEVIKDLVGYVEKDTLVEFFRNNNLID